MQVARLMNTAVHTCTADDTLEYAARLMWEHDLGCLVVVDSEHRPIAMVTDRDMAMAAYIQGRRLREIPVRTAMSHRIVACPPSCTIGEAERVMQQEQVRRMPVLDFEGRLIGIITLGDLAHAAAHGHRPLVAPRLAKTLAALTERRQ